MATHSSKASSIEKPKTSKEEEQLDVATPAGNGDLMSPLNTLTIREALFRYKRASAYCMLAAFSAICDGYQINLTGSIIANEGFIQQFGRTEVKGKIALKTQDLASWGGIQSGPPSLFFISGCQMLKHIIFALHRGQVLGMLSLNFLSDFSGRKIALYFLTVVLLASVIAEALATTWWHWLIAKFFAGVGVGMLQSTVPVYITELAPTQIRGALINAYSLWFVFGQFLGPLVLQRMKATDPMNYKDAIYSEFAWVAAMMVFFYFLPESPWWLVSHSHPEKARKVLLHVNGKVPGYDVDHEMQIMENVLREEKEKADKIKGASFFEIFKGVNLVRPNLDHELVRRTIIACWPKCMQQLTGLTLVNTYATYFFQLAGNKDPFLVTIILVVMQIISILLVIAFSDRYGRRTITVYGFGIAAISVLCIGIVGCFEYTTQSIGSLLIFFAALVMFFNTAAGAIGYAYLAEVPNQKWRARTAGFGAAAAASLGTCFSTSVPYMLRNNPGAGWSVRTGFFFGATGIPAVALAWFILPETAQRTAAEMDEMFENHVPARKFKGYETDARKAVAGTGVAADA